MNDPTNDPLDDFHDRIWRDYDQGRPQPIEDYLRDFPGLETEIVSLHAALERRSESQIVGATDAAGAPTRGKGLQGRRLGSYRLIEELGHGGQGFVYLAEDERLRRRVALKILPDGGRFSSAARLRFEREAETAGRLEHPGICRIHEFGEDSGVLYIAMEFVPGKTLAGHISETAQRASAGEKVTELHLESDRGIGVSTGRDRLPKGSTAGRSQTSAGHEDIMGAVRFIESAARALHAAHEAGLVHRDVKPGNLMVREDGSACVLDFGLAQDDLGDGMTLTQTGDLMGTPAYMSPEQLLANRLRLDRRTDVYSLGVCLFEACTLRRPFEEKSQQELYRSIAQKEPPSPRRLNAKIPKDLDAIILTALDKDRDRRYATALDLAEDLRRFRSYEPVAARPAGPLLKARRWVQRNRVVAASALVVFLALIATATVFYLKGEEARRARDQADEQARIARRETEKANNALREKNAALDSERTALSEKTKALSDYDRLADLKRLEAAIAAADLLYPPSPALVPRLEAWQKEYGGLAGKLGGHMDFLDELRAQALPYAEEERRRDFAAELAEIRQANVAIGRLDKALAGFGNDEAKAKAFKDKREEIAGRLGELEELTRSGRRSWRFADPALQFQHDVLTGLVDELRSFAKSDIGTVKSIAARMEHSRAIARETLGGDVATRWAACRKRVAQNAIYSGIDLAPQLGLVPLGPDPDSNLEEFLHWLTHAGSIPERDEQTGGIAVTEELGVILVLVPGGTFLMGSQRSDPAQANFDPDSRPEEQPVIAIELSAYFLSKYEMTQAQWQRVVGSNPSQYGPGTHHPSFKAPVDARHPVERVSWVDARTWLPRVDLMLPTEAEWERAARAGRSDQIHAGCSEVTELRGFANINGSETTGVGFTNQQPGHQDDWVVHAPVGSYPANAFGLHDMSGNVAEWCLDGSDDSYDKTPGPRGLRGEPTELSGRAMRGGNFGVPAVDARVAWRRGATADDRSDDVGIRPARGVTAD